MTCLFRGISLAVLLLPLSLRAQSTCVSVFPVYWFGLEECDQNAEAQSERGSCATFSSARLALSRSALDGDHADAHTLHFTHPMIAESISPDTKLRLNGAWQRLDRNGENELEFEGEYAFHRTFSVEAGVHYHPDTGDLGSTHVILKFANYAFEEQGVLLGYGVEVGLPTGPAGHTHGVVHEHDGVEHDHGPVEAEGDIYEIAPFLNAGLMTGRWELAGWTLFSIPTNHSLQESVGTSLRYHASVLYHATPRIEPLLEVYGHTGLSGLGAGEAVVNLAPGIRVAPLPAPNLALGVAVSVPITDRHEFDTHVLLSAFYHF